MPPHFEKTRLSEAFTSQDGETCQRRKCAPLRGCYGLAVFINDTRRPEVLPEMWVSLARLSTLASVATLATLASVSRDETIKRPRVRVAALFERPFS
jgi:hypothetical protein